MSHDEKPVCPCDDRVTDFEPVIAAALETLPRQTRTLSSVRLALLSAVRSPERQVLSSWPARGERDLGVLWLEMWAYVADVLNFYDERIANESYLRTAQRRPSLRKLIELLGYIQRPGVAGSVVLGAIAEGETPVTLPAGVGFRSDGFEDQPPHVYELDAEQIIEPQKNEWKIGPVDNQLLPQRTPSVAAGTTTSSSSRYFSFEASSLGVSVPAIIWLRASTGQEGVARVQATTPFQGADGRAYVEVGLSKGISLPNGTKPQSVAVRTPTNATLIEKSTRVGSSTKLRLNALVPQVQEGTRVVVAGDSESSVCQLLTVQGVKTRWISLADNREHAASSQTDPRRPVLEVTVGSRNSQLQQSNLSLHYDWVLAGKLATVRSPTVSPSDLTNGRRLPLEGILTPPRSGSTVSGELLLLGAQNQGAHVRGTVRIDSMRRGSVGVEETLSAGLPELEAKVSVFGNVLTASRGETVHGEVLGGGEPRTPSQSFQLRKKPLTYLPAPGTLRGLASTLTVTVDGVRWREVRTFFGCGPEDQVYIVRHDDEQETTITFGDGRRGARLPAGEENVRATYRFGSGAKAPPAGAVTQLARSVPGLRSVRSPVAARPGEEPDSIETLRSAAPRSLLLIGRAVSVLDFQVVAEKVTGVVRAMARHQWIAEQQSSGVQVSYIGDALPRDVLAELTPMADPSLSLSVVRAQPLVRRLELDVVVDPAFDQPTMMATIRERLTYGHGVLGARRAPIGANFWMSPIYEVVQGVPGVIAVASATLAGGSQLVDLAGRDVICPPENHYFDFDAPDSVRVNFSLADERELLRAVHGG